MATAAKPGFSSTFEVSSDGGTTYNKVGEIRGVKLTLGASPIKATSKDSGGWDEYIDGIKSGTFSGDALYLDGNAGQDAVFAAITGGTALKVRMRPVVGSSLKQFVGDVRITSYDVDSPLEDGIVSNIEGSFSGEIARSAQ